MEFKVGDKVISQGVEPVVGFVESIFTGEPYPYLVSWGFGPTFSREEGQDLTAGKDVK